MLQETRKDLLLVRALLDEVIPFMEAHPELVDMDEPSVKAECKCLGAWAATFQVCGLTDFSDIADALEPLAPDYYRALKGSSVTLAQRKAYLEQLYEQLVAA